MIYRLKFHAYCGMTTFDEGYESRAMARASVSALLRRRRKSGHQVTVLERGESWEVGEPEGCMMIPDTAGILYLAKVKEQELEEAVAMTTNQDGQTSDEWLVETFEYESCSECGQDADAHSAVMLLGNWIALCDPDRPSGQIHMRDIRLRNNAGLNFPVCSADEETLDLDKGRWVTSGDFDEVTCPTCREKAPVRYPWAYGRGSDELLR
jgi:hypothetical protein